MKYPDWAPLILVEHHKCELDGSIVSLMDCVDTGDEEILDYFNRYCTRPFNKESTDLLGKLISDLRMKEVWKTLTKRTHHDIYYCLFFVACEYGQSGWLKALKHTHNEHKRYYQEMHDTALKLNDLIIKSGKFDDYQYRMSALIENQRIDQLIKQAGFPRHDHELFKLLISTIMPGISDVLNDISEKAVQHRKEELLVKKPKSENAGIHFFVRRLSRFLKKIYQQPLHEVVATTTEVVFDLKSMDSDNVKKLVK